jgi:hypothetical protein
LRLVIVISVDGRGCGLDDGRVDGESGRRRITWYKGAGRD